MAKDQRGLELKEGDIILFNNMMLTIKHVKEGNIIGGLGIDKVKGQIQGQVLPGTLTCEVKLDFIPTNVIPVFKLAPFGEEKLDKGEGAQA